MTTNSILSTLFLIEISMVTSGLAIFFFLTAKKLRLKLARYKAEHTGNGNEPSLLQFFEDQIIRTRKRIAGKLSLGSEEEKKRESDLLNQRIEYLKLEKDIANEHVTDESYWEKITSRLANIISVNRVEETVEQSVANTDSDNEAYRKKIASYQAQLAALQEEFDLFRKYSKKVTSALSDYDKDADADKALNELMADFKAHDDRLHDRMMQLQKENETLQKNLSKAEREALAHDYQQVKQKTAAKGTMQDSGQSSLTTASEEELGRLKDIINRQYSSIDELKQAILAANESQEEAQHIESKLQAVERSQKELQDCIEVLETENQRLFDELEQARAATNNSGGAGETPQELYDLCLATKELKEKNAAQEQAITEKDEKIEQLEKELTSMQDEFMNMYTRGAE